MPWIARAGDVKAVPSDVTGLVECAGSRNVGLHAIAETMPNYFLRENARITAGAVAALVIVAWLAIIALAFLSLG